MGLLDDETSRLSHSLYRACEKCIVLSSCYPNFLLQKLKKKIIKQGLSGRSLRKLPFLAHAYHIKVNISFFFSSLSLGSKINKYPKIY